MIAGVTLAFLTAGPAVAADSDPTRAYANVQVVVTGYATPDIGDFGGMLECSGVANGLGFGVPGSTLESGLIEVPAGSSCGVTQFSGGDPGGLGQWGDWQASPAGRVVMTAGEVGTFVVTIQRSYNGQTPEWDNSGWFPFEILTVDRVALNKSGGITAEGVVLCKALGQAATGADTLIGISWDATQYVGRKTAIHGSYASDIAKPCFDPQHPNTPLRWVSLHPGGSGAVTAWVYGSDGRFASGTIRIDANAVNDLSTVTQWWDAGRDDYRATCSTTPQDDGWYDANGDGFCAFDVQGGQPATANIRTTQVRTR